MSELVRILKSVGLAGGLFAFLAGLGSAINALLPWEWLTNFFVIIRHFSAIFDFTWDMDTLWALVGLILLIEISVWVFRAGLTAINYFKN